MKKKDENKPNQGLKKSTRELQHVEIQQILQQTELPIVNKFSDKSLDRANEKFLLLSGFETSWKELVEAHEKFKKFIAAKKRDYVKTFPDEIYDEWRRLNNWNKRPYAKHHKPPIFGRYTKLFIYGRLPREILPTLEDLNDYIYPGIRLYKHFELVTDQTYSDIKQYIQDVIDEARASDDMYEFRVRYAAKYGLPFQLSLFRDNDSIIASI